MATWKQMLGEKALVDCTCQVNIHSLMNPADTAAKMEALLL